MSVAGSAAGALIRTATSAVRPSRAVRPLLTIASTPGIPNSAAAPKRTCPRAAAETR